MKKCTKSIKYLKLFKEENEKIFYLGVFSFVFSISYIVTEMFPNAFVEWFVGADKVYNYLYNISLAIVASIIFYFIQSFIKEAENKEKYSRLIRMDVYDILRKCDDLIYIFSKATNEDINNIAAMESKLCEIEEEKFKNAIIVQIKKIKDSIESYERKPFSIMELDILIQLKSIRTCDLIYVLDYMMHGEFKGKKEAFNNTDSLKTFIWFKNKLNELYENLKQGA